MSRISCVTGKAVPIIGDDIDTDQIVPARFLKEITFEKMGDYLFYDLRYTSSGTIDTFPLNVPTYKEATVMIVGRNFGCGSSREHAPQAIKRYGFNAVIGVSFAEIFASNCLSLGVPVIRLLPADIDSITAMVDHHPNSILTIDLATKEVCVNDHIFSFSISPSQQEAFLSGSWNVLNLLKANHSLILDKDTQLNGFDRSSKA